MATMKMNIVRDRTKLLVTDFTFITLASVYFIIRFQSFIIQTF